MIPYDIDFKALTEKIKALGFSKLLLQLPEGMQIYAFEIAEKLSEFDVYISANPCYGACDIEVYDDTLTLQFGHSRIPNIKYPKNVLFVEAFSNASFTKALEKFLEKVQCKSVGLIASIQHIKALDTVKDFLESHHIEVHIGRGDARITYPGQVLGCNFSAAREVREQVDCFAFLGTGEFHALGAKIATGKDVYILNPYSSTVNSVDEGRFLRQRYGAIARGQSADKFGIIISSKIGQRRWKLAEQIARIIENEGKEAHIILADNIVPENLYYDVDVYVNTACPRITYDDFSRFKRVVLTPGEALMALGKKSMENLTFDEIVEVN